MRKGTSYLLIYYYPRTYAGEERVKHARYNKRFIYKTFRERIK